MFYNLRKLNKTFKKFSNLIATSSKYIFKNKNGIDSQMYRNKMQ